MSLAWEILWRAGLLLPCVPLGGIAGVLIWTLVEDARRLRAGRWPLAMQWRFERERRPRR
jgi:hypothetical protein